MCWDRIIECEEIDQWKAQVRRVPSQSPEPSVEPFEKSLCNLVEDSWGDILSEPTAEGRGASRRIAAL